MDARLLGLARSADAIYTRYADDLAFSGGESFRRDADRFQLHVGAIVWEEGFRVHHRKTRIMRRGVRQRLTGVVVNDKLNLCRPDYDRLKATLVNCVRRGAASQNHAQHSDFRGFLQGRVAFVESIHSEKGKRLRRLFEQISW